MFEIKTYIELNYGQTQNYCKTSRSWQATLITLRLPWSIRLKPKAHLSVSLFERWGGDKLKGEGGRGRVGLLCAFARSHAAVRIPSTAKPISENKKIKKQQGDVRGEEVWPWRDSVGRCSGSSPAAGFTLVTHVYSTCRVKHSTYCFDKSHLEQTHKWPTGLV